MENDQKNEYIDPKSLEDGKILNVLKEIFLSEPTKDNYISLLRCLRDSIVYVPVMIGMSAADEEKFMNGGVGDTVSLKEDMHIRPDILQDDKGNLFFPVFSQEEQIPEDYKQFSRFHIAMEQCIEMALNRRDLAGIVLDAYTRQVKIPMEIAELILQLPSRLKPEDA